ncbi:MAG: GHKL domain-containing protein [Lachnospiraceae bacterium]|nr:GHKL domain-containing protein [Lachnospiraceae bacterium]
MIAKLQRKITWMIFLILSTVLGGIVIAINISNWQSTIHASDRFMELFLNPFPNPLKEETLDSNALREEIPDINAMSETASDGIPLSEMAPDQAPSSDNLLNLSESDENLQNEFSRNLAVPFGVEYARLTFDSDMNLLDSSMNISGIRESTIADYAREILENRSLEGTAHDLKYQMRIQKNGEYTLIFLNITPWIKQMQQALLLSACGLLIGFLAFGLLAHLLARNLVRPVAQSFERQQQFISDASHEFKTPLAVIRANADVLESEIGENKWLTCIQTEISRTGDLISSLLTLARLDSGSERKLHARFDLSHAILSVLMPFESMAYEKEVLLDWTVPPEIDYFGNETQIKQLTAILIDNAVKHAWTGSTISIRLQTVRHKLLLSVTNTGDTIPKEELNRIFERFYRIDKSRSREEGRYGLGLAIAQQIMKAHRGTLQAESENHQTTFTALFPLR